MRRLRLAQVLCGAALAACGGHAPPRTGLSITGFHGLLASNSPSVTTPPLPQEEGDGVHVRYSFLVEAFADEAVSLGIGRATLVASGKPASVRCTVQGKTGDALLVQRGERRRVDCDLHLSPALRTQLAGKDAAATLRVPVRSSVSEGAFVFVYVFRSEDFS